MYVKPLICVLGYLLQDLLKCALHLFSLRLKCYYNQRNSVGTERKNIVPGNLCIIWKLNEAWPLKKDSAIFLRLLKLLKLKKSSTTALRLLKFLILKKGLHHFLTTHFFTKLVEIGGGRQIREIMAKRPFTTKKSFWHIISFVYQSYLL